jgi:adenylate cyclase
MSAEKVRGKIVYSLSLLMMIFIILSFISYSQLEKTEEIRKIDEDLENLLLQNLKLFKNDVDFVEVELNNPDYFKNAKSVYLDNHVEIIAAIRGLIISIEERDYLGMNPALNHIDSVLTDYDNIFSELVARFSLLGYKDFGYEGKLKELAHILSEKKVLNEIDILTLRKYEKNYLMHDDHSYADKFLNLIDDRLSKLNPSSEKALLLIDYKEAFIKTLEISAEIGRYTHSGLKSSLNIKTDELIEALDNLSKLAEYHTVAAYNFGMNIFLICAIISAAACFFVIIFIAKNLR